MLLRAVWQRLGRDAALRVIFLIALISSVYADTPQSADILAFDLSPISESSEAGLLTISLGQNAAQKVDVLVAPYTNSGVMMEVPVAMRCTNGPTGDWNVIFEPSAGAVVLAGNSTDGGLTGDGTLGGEGTKVVRWKAARQTPNGEVLKLTLRKGKGEKVRNVTVVEGMSCFIFTGLRFACLLFLFGAASHSSHASLRFILFHVERCFAFDICGEVTS
jgi:hypothetical protein